MTKIKFTKAGLIVIDDESETFIPPHTIKKAIKEKNCIKIEVEIDFYTIDYSKDKNTDQLNNDWNKLTGQM